MRQLKAMQMPYTVVTKKFADQAGIAMDYLKKRKWSNKPGCRRQGEGRPLKSEFGDAVSNRVSCLSPMCVNASINAFGQLGEKTWPRGWAEKQCTLFDAYERGEILALWRRSSGTKEEDSHAQFSFECPWTATLL
ncbi:hypothetical protein PH562_05145 [Rhizobium sp. CNPSo 4062]|uniref:hypothetical protein n=1 Tax=Rhizobium sp. CNPSo 4062 TaxID=3021410 RepID=UPI00254A56EC|nr:hypothetical protein [Rhizobium sp. CNPSo 4062]MDK4701617.1 hypothetical protein [Rhizobium sp. CNPSo 4062]